VRCPGAITRDRLELVRESDAILREEFALCGLDQKVWQYFTVVPPFKSTGIENNKRTFEYMVVIRAVNSIDATSASVEESTKLLFTQLRARPAPTESNGNYFVALWGRISILSTR
jgi:GMP synthase (glutamine-hydrolysing)